MASRKESEKSPEQPASFVKQVQKSPDADYYSPQVVHTKGGLQPQSPFAVAGQPGIHGRVRSGGEPRGQQSNLDHTLDQFDAGLMKSNSDTVMT